MTDLPLQVRRFFLERGLGQSNNTVGNVTPIIQAMAYVPDVKTLPCWRGTPLTDPARTIAFTNGLLDLGRRELVGHSPDWVSVSCLPFEFDPSARCPAWLRFLDEVFEGDAERVALLQEYVGYLLSGRSNLQVALCMVGKSRSGKGTVSRTVEKLIGDGATGFSLDRLATEHGPTQLAHKSVALVGEIELNTHPHRGKIVEVLKGIIGEDEITMNRKHDPDIQSVRLPTRFLLSCNDTPRLLDSSGAMANRLLFLPFDMSFLGREDRDLESKLAAELPGIANWALQGLDRLTSNGGRFTVGERSRRERDRFGSETTPVRQFVLERCEVAPHCDARDIPGVRVAAGAVEIVKPELYASYSAWCTETNTEAKTEVWFGRELTRLLPKVAIGERRRNGGRVRVYVGVRLAPDTGDTGISYCGGNFQKDKEEEEKEGEDRKLEGQREIPVSPVSAPPPPATPPLPDLSARCWEEPFPDGEPATRIRITWPEWHRLRVNAAKEYGDPFACTVPMELGPWECPYSERHDNGDPAATTIVIQYDDRLPRWLAV